MYEDMTARPEEWASSVGHFLGILAPTIEEVEAPSSDSSFSTSQTLAPPPPLPPPVPMPVGGLGSQSANQWDFLSLMASQQMNVVANDSTHTAYFLPGAHLRLLSNATLSWLY